ncbi:WD40-repeat-containing domain protein [Kockiozyma suomiensis]|uniref:WD40-repeat-containing domain protein n=1 Tax=Kockiozyma suomiensis TaxID=1337062 RepID=UPI003342FD36
MDPNEPSSSIGNFGNEEEAYLDPSAAFDVVEDDEQADGDAPMSDLEDDDDDNDDDDEGVDDEDNAGEDVPGEIVEEIDMSNNSTTYFDKHTDSIFLVGVHPKLPLVITGGGDDTGYVWTSHSVPPKLVTTLTGHTDSLVTGGFSPDGEWLVTGGMDGRVRIWRARARGQKWEFWDSVEEVEEVTWITFHPSQSIFAFGANDGSAWVYALLPKLEVLCTLYGHSSVCTAGVFVPPTQAPAEGDEEEINLVTVADDGVLISWSVPSAVQNYKITPVQFHYEAPWINMSLHPSGTSVAVGSADGKVAIVGTKTGSVIATVDVLGATGSTDMAEADQSVEGMAWCEAVGILAVGLVAGVICLFDTGSWRVRRTLEVGDAVTKIEFIPNSAILVSSSMDGCVRRWDVRTGEEQWKGTGHSSGVLGFALSSDGSTLITASDEGVALVYK